MSRFKSLAIEDYIKKKINVAKRKYLGNRRINGNWIPAKHRFGDGIIKSGKRGFDCSKNEKIARDNNPNYYEICVGDTGKVKGIGTEKENK